MKVSFRAIAMLLVAVPLFAEDLHVHSPQFNDPLLVSRPVAGLVLDGQLDEPEWGGADAAAGFLTPVGAKPLATKVRVLHDSRNLYLGITCAVPDRKALVTRHGEGGPVYRDDSVEIFLDPAHDGERCLQICVNADGHAMVLDLKTQTASARDGYLDTRAGWNQETSSYVLEIALDRSKLGIIEPPTRAMGIAFLRNQEVDAISSSRQFRSLWRTTDPRRWGNLYLLDDKSLAGLRAHYRKRLATVLKAEISPDLMKEANGLLLSCPGASAGLPDKEQLASFEKALLDLESRAYGNHWRNSFRKLF